MRFCVNGRQPHSVLRKADEFKFSYKDKERIFDIIDVYNEKTIILEAFDEEDWKVWQLYDEKFAEFYIALGNLKRAQEFNEHNIKWYWPYPVTSFYELSMIISLNPSYILLGPPLSFDLDEVVKNTKDIPLRMVANVARPDYIPKNEMRGIRGQWIRPEDITAYEEYIRCLEFDECQSLKEESTLLEVYQKRYWPGNLNLLIKKLDFNIDNRLISEDFGEIRANCGQRCWNKNRCHLCESILMFASKIREEKYKREKEKLVEK